MNLKTISTLLILSFLTGPQGLAAGAQAGFNQWVESIR